jgi:serine/alanine adding enzyme
MRIVRSLKEELWKDFVDNHPCGNIFHTSEMFKVFAKTNGYRPELWAAVDGQSEILALFLPAHITLMNGLFRRFTTRSVGYGGLLYQDSNRGKEGLHLLLDAYTKNIKGQSLFTELRNLYNLADLHSLLEQYGYFYEHHLNYLIDLGRPPEKILQSIGSRTRKKIRKGLREGHVQIDEVTSRNELAYWYEILQKTYDKAQVLLADLSLFEATFDILYPKGMAKFFLARVHGVTAACSVELPYKDTIYGWYGGCDRAYREYVPNEMLIWHILEWGANNGYRLYDFGGAGRPDEEYGVRDFKAKFNGELVCFGRNVCVHAPKRLALSRWSYKMLRSVFS